MNNRITIQEELKRSPCDIYEERLVNLDMELILTTDLSIAKIARHLTLDPPNISKFFKHFTRTTRKKFRDAHTGGEWKITKQKFNLSNQSGELSLPGIAADRMKNKHFPY